jgi:hypothetical protein
MLIGAATASEGSKLNIPPAPIVKLEPSRRAVFEVTTSVPAVTVVPPLYVPLPLRIRVAPAPLKVKLWLPAMLLGSPKTSFPLPLTTRLSARMTGASMT